MRVVRSTPVPSQQKLWRRNIALGIAQAVAGSLLLIMPPVGLLPATGLSYWIVILIGTGLLISSAWFGIQIAMYRSRHHIEERLCEVLQHTLGDEYIYFRNLMLPGQRSVGEIDGVLLGPPGAIVLYVEHQPGEFSIEGDTWYRYGRGKVIKVAPKPLSLEQAVGPLSEPRQRLDDSPTWAAIRAAREVKAWLSVRGLPQVVVLPLVILGNGHLRFLKRPSAPVTELDDVEYFIRETLAVPAVSSEGEPLAGVVVEQIAHRLQANAD